MRFSLRGLLLAVTLFACVLGYYCNWIHQRHAFVAEQAEIYSAKFRPPRIPETLSRYFHDKAPSFVAQFGRVPASAPRALALLREAGVANLNMIVPQDEAVQVRECCWEVDESHPHIIRARALFPEATIYAFVWDQSDPQHPQLRGAKIAQQSPALQSEPGLQGYALVPKP